MKKEENVKSKNLIIILLLVIIFVLIILLVLMATGKIAYNSNLSNKCINEPSSDSNIQVKNVRYFQYYEEYGMSTDGSLHQYYSSEIELNSDMTARWHTGGTNAGGRSIEGSYTEDSEKILLTFESDTIKTLTLNKIPYYDRYLKSIDEPGNISRVYRLVGKELLYHFD